MTDPHDSDLVTLESASTPFAAQVIAVVLRDADIPVYVGSSLLQDEFAVSQQLLNLKSVHVQVREADLQRAREALAAAREAGHMLEDASEFGSDVTEPKDES